ncbi:hypothetical protein GIB67_005046 [Kingdonia uniflora]|uniref:DUF8040 domain-containing protein n=1 Tax=Kingdonia uniflora TaxID=39325 RepID=A0A7J7NND3_9MAGN|nr:hypothetical protein GIB67_005046 [Kingdonia uniflora]
MDSIDNENKRKVAIPDVVVAAYAASLLLNIPMEPYTNKDYEREKYMADILTSEEELCHANLHMGIQTFHRLCSLVRDKGLMQHGKNCKVEEGMMRTQVKMVSAYFILHNHVMGVEPNDPLLAEVDRELRSARNNVNEDSTRKTVTISNAKWVELLETPKCRDKWAKLKDKGLEWDEAKLEVVIGKDNTTEVDRLDGMNCMNVDKYDNANAEISVHVADPSLVQNLDECDVSTNVYALLGKRWPQCDKEKRQHKKKMQNVDEVKEMIQGVSEET